MSKFNTDKEFDLVSKHNNQTGWDDVRNADKNYDLKSVLIESLGEERNILFLKKETKHKDYEMLQCSRGISIKPEFKNINDLSQSIKEEIKNISDADTVRIDELKEIFGNDLSSLRSIAELGFRIPKILDHYLRQGFEKAIGFDVVELNVNIGIKLGYDVRVFDFNDPKKDVDLSDIGLVISYHMLEHLSRPDIAIKKIYNGMKKGSFFHVEIPIEPDGPRIRYGHLYPFMPKDMMKFLDDAGFKVIFGTNNTHVSGPWVERYLAQKV